MKSKKNREKNDDGVTMYSNEEIVEEINRMYSKYERSMQDTFVDSTTKGILDDLLEEPRYWVGASEPQRLPSLLC